MTKHIAVKPAVFWALAGAWAVLFGPPGLPGKGLIPGLSYEMALAATVIASLLLSTAVVVSIARSLASPALTLGSITSATGSLAVFCSVVGMLVYMHGIQGRLILSMSAGSLIAAGIETGKLERFYDFPNKKSSRMAASMVYRETGLRIGYRGEDGLPVIFEPDAKDEQSRSERRDFQRDAIPLREKLERHANFLRATALIYLASLPFVALLYLLRVRHHASLQIRR